MSVCCECCMLSDRGLCYGLIPRPEESYRLWSVIVCDPQTSKNEAALAHVGLLCQKINKNPNMVYLTNLTIFHVIFKLFKFHIMRFARKPVLISSVDSRQQSGG